MADKPSVFISYASADREVAKHIATACRARGIEAWFAESDLRVGQNAFEEINEAIKASQVCVVLVSRFTNPHAPWPALEWAQILEQAWRRPELKILPVQLDADAPLSPFLREWRALLAPRSARLPAATAAEVAGLISEGSTGRSGATGEAAAKMRFRMLSEEIHKAAAEGAAEE
jgi:hypothetical protein